MCTVGGMAAFPVTDKRPDVAAGDPMTINYVPNLVHNVHEYVAAIVSAARDRGLSRAAGRRVDRRELPELPGVPRRDARRVPRLALPADLGLGETDVSDRR